MRAFTLSAVLFAASTLATPTPLSSEFVRLHNHFLT